MSHSLVRGADMTATTHASGLGGSAERWGPLWGARAADWALSEDQQTPTYEAALGRVALEPGQRVLDIGCGAGAFLRLVADRGARPARRPSLTTRRQACWRTSPPGPG